MASNRIIKSFDTNKKQNLVIGDDLEALVGTTISIKCPITGNPHPQIKWTKSGVPISVSPRLTKIENNTLTIFGGRWSDTGRYTCTASNAAGSDSKSSFIDLVRKYYFERIFCNGFDKTIVNVIIIIIIIITIIAIIYNNNNNIYNNNNDNYNYIDSNDTVLIAIMSKIIIIIMILIMMTMMSHDMSQLFFSKVSGMTRFSSPCPTTQHKLQLHFQR